MGWKGYKVRHADGRTGVIAREHEGFLRIALTIDVEQGDKDHVQLNANGPDTGSAGWQWDTAEPGSSPDWLPLGDFAVQRAREGQKQ